MTQNDKDLKELLLKDLCARLPYGVKCRTSRKHGLIRIKNCVLDCHWLTEVQNDFYEIKPYLFPLSSMTEEQVEKLQEELCDMYDPYHDYDSYENWGVEVLKKHIHSVNYKFTFTADVVDWLNQNHFDYRGLIEKSLAIDATNLGIYK